MERPKSKDFRYVYSNAVTAAFNGSEMILTVGIKADQSDASDQFVEEVAIVLTPSSAKLWGQTISKIIASFENTSGQSIPVDDEKMKRLDEVIAAAEQASKVQKARRST